MNERLEYFGSINEKLPHKEYSCLSNNGLLKVIHLSNVIGSGLFGNVYGGKLRTTEKKQKFEALKKRKTPENIELVIKVAYSSHSHIKEAHMAYDVSNLVINKICPHFPLLYEYYMCNNVTFQGKGVHKEAGDWKLIKRGTGVIQIQEYTGISFKDWLLSKPSGFEIEVAVCQILIALYALHKHGNIYHGDCYFSNVTMYKLKEPTYYIHKINNKTYHLLSKSYIPMLIDFGQSGYLDENKSKVNEDAFLFLSDFSVSSRGIRPHHRHKRIIITKDVPNSTKKILSEMTKYMVNMDKLSEQNTKKKYIKNKLKPLQLLQKFLHERFQKKYKLSNIERYQL